MAMVEIYFADLKEKKQKELLEAFSIESPDDMNWDTMPIDIIEVDDEITAERLSEDAAARAEAAIDAEKDDAIMSSCMKCGKVDIDETMCESCAAERGR